MDIYNGEKKMSVSNESSRQTFMDNEVEEERKRWTDVGKYNMEDLWLTVENTGNRAEWRRRTSVADLSPEGFTA